MMKRFLVRHQPSLTWRKVGLAGLGGAITIGLLSLLGEVSHAAVLMGSLGASCVLVFAAPDAPFSQPVNVVGGHLIGALSGLAVMAVLPVTWWSIAIAVGLSIAVMAALRLTHPPAGANPIAVMTVGAAWSYAFTPVLIGAVGVVILGLLFHRITGTSYPKPRPS